METNNLISIKEVIAAILVQCNDAELKSGFTRGWYQSRIKDCFDDLAYTTFFYEDTLDIINFDPNKTGKYFIPENIFNIREAYLWKGECCTLQDSVIVHWKKRFNNINGKTTGTYTSFRNDSRECPDAFYWKDYLWNRHNICYGNIQNGFLMINTVNWDKFPNLRLVFNGTKEGDLTEEKIVPRFFKELLVASTCEKFFLAMSARDRTFLQLAATYTRMIEEPRNGLRIKAERLVRDMSSWAESDLDQYIQKANAGGY